MEGRGWINDRPRTRAKAHCVHCVHTHISNTIHTTHRMGRLYQADCVNTSKYHTHRMGRPCCRSWSGLRPMDSAMRRTGSEGTKQRSTSLWNHVGCAPPKSVTTVTKGMRRLLFWVKGGGGVKGGVLVDWLATRLIDLPPTYRQPAKQAKTAKARRPHK